MSTVVSAEKIAAAKKGLAELNKNISKVEKVANNMWLSSPIIERELHHLKLKRAAVTMLINGMTVAEIEKRTSIRLIV